SPACMSSQRKEQTMGNPFNFLFDAAAMHGWLDQIEEELQALRHTIQVEYPDAPQRALESRLFDVRPTIVQSLVRSEVLALYQSDPSYEQVNGEALADYVLAPLDEALREAREHLTTH